jgi:hypothetical protein
MINDKIVTEKQLNYIETLYLYANLEDFVEYESNALDWLLGEVNQHTHKMIGRKDILNLYSSEKYSLMMDYIYDTMLHSAEFLGDSKGRAWYKFTNYRLGIMDYDTAKKSNQFNIEIQYTQAHMFTLDPELKGLELPFDGTIDQYYIKRIDVSQIVKTPIDYLTNYNYISPYRAMDRFSKNGRTETVYLGHRKSGNVFRMYNKTIELNVDTKDHPIDFKKIELFAGYFGDIEDLYTFELELHRKYFKSTFGIDTLADLDKVYKAHKEIVGKIRVYEDNDYNRKLLMDNNRDRIDSLFFVEYEEFKRVLKKKYKTSERYMVDKAVGAFNRYEDSLDEPLSLGSKFGIIDMILSRILGDKDVTIEFDDSDCVKEYNAFIDKAQLLRGNHDDQLFKESNEAFSPIMLQNSNDLF